MNDLLAHLDRMPQAMLVLFRIGGLTIYAPLFASQSVPARVKVFLTLVIGLAVYPTIESRHLDATPLTLELWSLVPLLGLELLIGMVVGFAALLPLIAVQMGGLIMGQQMGLGLARFFNPELSGQTDVIGQLLFLVTLAGFLLIGGHEAMLLAMLHSFGHIPLGGFVADAGLVTFLTGLMTAMLELSLRVAAPLLCLIFLQSAAVGFVTKTVPQFNILSLGFPLRILVGILMICLGLTVIDEVVMQSVDVVLFEIFGFVER